MNGFIELPSEVEKLKHIKNLIDDNEKFNLDNNIKNNIKITNLKLALSNDKKIFNRISNIEKKITAINRDYLEDEINFDE